MHNAAKICFETNPEMEDEGDDGRALHEVHPVLRQPVEGLQEQQQHEQSHELRREIVPGDTEKNLRVQKTKVLFLSVAVLRIQSVYPGSEFFHCGSGSATKNLGICNLKNCYQALGNMTFSQCRISESKKQRITDPDPQPCSVFIVSFGLFLCTCLQCLVTTSPCQRLNPEQ
jgi:hypothetical protein